MTPRNASPRLSRPSAASKTRQAGAALLAAMLTVTLVATLAAAALWQQWRAVEVEQAERARVQSAWVLIGALDWARLILRADGNAGGPDHLGEPWAIPLEEARLSSFLSAEKNVSSASLEGLPDALLSGRIVDAQSKLNVMNLVSGNKPDAAAVASFKKLFSLLALPVGEVDLLANGVQRAMTGITTVTTTAPTAAAAGAATDTATTPAAATPTTTTTVTTSTSAGDDAQAPSVPLMPIHTSQLVWFGLSPQTVAALQPYVTVLPAGTPLNINTASAEAIYASVPGMDMAAAKQVVARRTLKFFSQLPDTDSVLRDQAMAFNAQRHSVSTNYFEVEGKLRLDNTFVEENSLLRRDGIKVTVLWRERGAGATQTAAPR
ncbi:MULTISPECIES: type II secretion system minor pseudopilin GspK [unclassified Variovorax]|uniref:type II secretion system minor pseudopilin GspK n=1 Tax=unclassified Variovorax TaxID=663243 RepID=UPI001BD6CFDB|nr:MULTISPECIES: type II secretion system minor pseudopilin GspK [unclassified Variovorax]